MRRLLLGLLCIVILLESSPVFAQEERSYEGRIDAIETMTCDDESEDCLLIHLRLDDSYDGNRDIDIEVTPLDFLGGRNPGYSVGDTVIVQSSTIDGEAIFFIADIVRKRALLLLLGFFAVAVVLCGGWAAARSFIGMALSFAILFLAILPLILHGFPPIPVSIIGALAIMAVTFLISHGWNVKTQAALAGTTISLLITAILALFFSWYAHLSGIDEETAFLLSDFPLLDTRGILLAGIIIGTLGVLDDITISQASAVMELRIANPLLQAKQLYKSALRIGNDHISAAVNTLVLAYAGSSIPLLLLLSSVPSGESWSLMLNREVLAVEIVRTLVGSIGLLCAVPVTTWCACMLAVRQNPDTVAHAGQHHH